jgi:pimeloyl-ACP methyl ester carboxylesterase
VAPLPLATTVTGRGEAVLLVHGWSGFKEAWLTLPRALADAGLAAMAVDLPGWGESPAPRGFAHTPAAYAHALERALEHSGPAHLIGHSMGAQACIVLALRRPDLVRRLALIGPAATPFRPVAFPPGSMRDVVRYPLIGVPLTRLLLLHVRRRPDLWRESYLRAFAHPERLEGVPGMEALLELAHRRLTTVPTSTFARAAPPLLAFDARPAAHRLTAPTLVVLGRLDRVANVTACTEFARALPDGELLLVDDVAHFPHLEAPATVEPAVVAHLAGTAR